MKADDNYPADDSEELKLKNQSLNQIEENSMINPQLPSIQEKEEKPKEKKGVINKMGNITKGALNGIKKAGAKVGGITKNTANKVADQSKAIGTKFKKDYMIIKNELTSDVKGRIKDLKDDLINDLANSKIVTSTKEKINSFIRLKIEAMIVASLKKAPPVLKEALKDPDMCKCVKKLVDDMVDEFWPDVQEEIFFRLRLITNKPHNLLAEPPKYKWYNFICCKFRNWFRYTYDPVDRSIWRQMKNPCNWIIWIIASIPFYQIQAFFKFFTWLMVDKSDEYQLITFILDFKSLQFFTIGCLGGLIGYINFYNCVHYFGGYSKTSINRCAAQGEMDPIIYGIEISGFVLQIVMIWISYLLTPLSKKKGELRFKYRKLDEKVRTDIDDETCCNCTRGGRLKKFMLWELVTEIVYVILVFTQVFFLNQNDEVTLRSALYFCRTIYGLMSFPFMVFAIQPLATFLTKTRATKYDKFGRCVPDLPSLFEVELKKKKLMEAKEKKKLDRKKRVEERERKRLEFRKKLEQGGSKEKKVDGMMNISDSEMVEDFDDLLNNEEVFMFDFEA